MAAPGLGTAAGTGGRLFLNGIGGAPSEPCEEEPGMGGLILGGKSIGMDTSDAEHDVLVLRDTLRGSTASRTDDGPSDGAMLDAVSVGSCTLESIELAVPSGGASGARRHSVIVGVWRAVSV